MRRGDLLIVQGEPSAWIFFIELGSVLAFRCSLAGREVAIAYLGCGDACGMEDALSGQPCSCTYQVLAPGMVWCVGASDLRVGLQDFPTLAQAVVGYMAGRLRSVCVQVALVTLEDLATRVKEVLSHCIAASGISGGPVFLPLTQSQLAALVGASRQRVNAILVGLHRLGVVESHNNGMMILDPSVFQMVSHETPELSRS